MIFDVGNVLVNVWKVWKEDREFQAWVKMVMSTVYSGFIAFTGTTGIALVAKTSPWVAVGSGLIACAVSVFSVMLRYPQAKSLMISVPGEVEKQYEVANQSVSEPESK